MNVRTVLTALVRPHVCAHRCGFRTQRVELLAHHYWTHHFGEPVPPKGTAS